MDDGGKGAGIERNVTGGRWSGDHTGQGGAAQGDAVGVIEVKGAGAGGDHLAGIARERVEEGLRFEFGDERFAGGDQGFKLAGFGLEVADLPKALEHGGGFGGEAYQQGEVAGGKAVHRVVVDADDADDLTIVFHGHGHFRGGGGADTHVTQVTGDIGHELGAGVKSGPAGHTLAHAQGDFAVVGRQADLSFNLEPAGVGIEQGNRAGRGVEVGDEFAENARQHDVGFIALKAQGRDSAKGGLVG